MTEWQDIRIGDLGRVITGKTPPTSKPEYYGGTTQFLTPTDMDGRRIINQTLRYLSEEGENKVSSSLLPKGSVSVSCIGSDMGKTVLVGKKSVTNQQINSVIVEDKFDNLFVYYNLSGRKSELQFLASGAAQPIMNKTDFSNLTIKVPPLNIQRTIASVLGALDDKIENNRQMNETLEEMARAIFKSWFVDFDPVHAKAAGKPPSHMDAETAALFPSSFGDDGLPVGWHRKSLDQIADFLNGAAMQKFPAEGDQFLPVIKIAELRNGISSNTNRATPDVPQKYLVSDGDVLFAWSGSLMQKVWTEGTGALNQHLFKITSETYQKWFFYYWIDHHMKWFQSIAASKATTMGHIQRSHLTEAKVCVPDSLILDSASANIAPLLGKQIQNSLENKTLAELRDTLLPKLMSGEIRVKDAEREVEAAV